MMNHHLQTQGQGPEAGMRRPTIQDLAAAAGVSVATVDRVLNGRLRVREETARKVSEAAERIGYHGATAIRQRVMADLPEYHLAIVLQRNATPFTRPLPMSCSRRPGRSATCAFA